MFRILSWDDISLNRKCILFPQQCTGKLWIGILQGKSLRFPWSGAKGHRKHCLWSRSILYFSEENHVDNKNSMKFGTFSRLIFADAVSVYKTTKVFLACQNTCSAFDVLKGKSDLGPENPVVSVVSVTSEYLSQYIHSHLQLQRPKPHFFPVQRNVCQLFLFWMYMCCVPTFWLQLNLPKHNFSAGMLKQISQQSETIAAFACNLSVAWFLSQRFFARNKELLIVLGVYGRALGFRSKSRSTNTETLNVLCEISCLNLVSNLSKCWGTERLPCHYETVNLLHESCLCTRILILFQWRYSYCVCYAFQTLQCSCTNMNMYMEKQPETDTYRVMFCP